MRRAVQEIAAALAERIAAHPWRRHLRSQDHEVELALRIPLGSGRSLEEATSRAEDAIADAIARLMAQHSTFSPGRVLCLRCGATGCEHASPTSSRQVFAGYGATGLPRFVDLQQLLVELRDPRVDRLFANPPRILTLGLDEETLHRELLPSYRSLGGGFRLLGQVCAGWYELPRGDGPGSELLALSFQLLSNGVQGGERPERAREAVRLAINVLGVGPDAGPLEHVLDRFPAAMPPWGEALGWAHKALADVERGARLHRRDPGSSSAAKDEGATGAEPMERSPWEQRALGVLAGLERRLQRRERSTRRRTVHAEERRRVQRPVGRAIAELQGARPEDVLWDRHRQTLVVLGERGRAHVWSPEGRLVTSIHFTADAVERRKRRGRWRQAPREQVETLRERVAGGAEG